MTATNQVLVAIESAGNSWRVAIRKGPGVPAGYGQHPVLLTTEADALAQEIRDAAAECRRRNAGVGRRWP